MSPQLSPDCGAGCRSHQHGQIISAAIIRGTGNEAIAYLKSICQRYCYVSDKSGKSALHTAASCGKKKLVKWLLAHGVNVNQKDLESGYTPLHRALFYGFIHIACTLIDAGGNLTTLDHDALTPLDHVIKDRPGIVELSPRLPTQIYLWGDNANYNLGQSSQQAKSTPECLEVLHRDGQSIIDVSMSKFHTLFLTSTGQVYACGHGHGGRLGLDTDGAPVISPRQVKALAHTAVTMIAAAHDHSLMLTEGGQVWTCGLNEYHQLGQNPPVSNLSSPRPITWHKTNKQIISGIGAGRYHSVMWNSTSLYTFGLNAGQMGHHKNVNERTIVNPRLVTSLVLKEGVEINSVGVSDGAVVVNFTDGDIYVMHQYQTRQVASKQLGVIKVACIGGQLDPKVGAEGLTEHGGVDLKIAALVGGESGYLYLWSAQNTRLVRCLFLLNREITLTDFCLNRQGFGLVTKDGEAFSGALATSKIRKSKTKDKSSELSGSSPLVEFIDRKACETIRLTRIYTLHRTVAIRSDSKGRNFAALQNDPKSFMMEIPQVSPSSLLMDIKTLKRESSTMDAIHDVEIVSGNRTFPAHSYVLAYHSEFFRKKLINTSILNGNPEHDENCEEVFGEKHSIKIPPDVAPQVMEEILEYIYTGTCQLTRRGPCDFKLPINNSIVKGNINSSPSLIPNGDVSNKSAFSVYKEMEESTKSNRNNKKNKKKGSESKDVTPIKSKKKDDDPIRVVERVAKRFGLAAMESALKSYQLVDKCVQLRNIDNFSESGNASYPNKYNRKLHEILCDVVIQSKDGDLLGAHKCILAARLEYFQAMLGSGWMETKASKSLSMPLPTKILSILLDYLYEDEAEGVNKSKDAEFVCNVLAVADQFLCPRLIEICEVRLSELLSLKNAAELLEFSDSYHASQLKKASMQFICLNLETLLENGSLLMLSSSVQSDLSDYYRAFIPRMSCRMLTPYDCLPYSEDLQQVLEENPVDLPDSDEDDWDPQLSIRIEGKNTSNTGSTKKKKRIHRTSSSESRPRKTSTSSQFSVGSSEGDVSELGDEFEALTFDDLEERTSPVPLKMRDEKREDESEAPGMMQPLQISPWQKVKKKNSTSSSHSNIPPSNLPDQKVIVKQSELSKLNNVRPKTTSPQPIELSNNADRPIKAQQYPTLADAFVSPPKYVMQAKSSGKMGKVSQKQRKKMALALDTETANMQEVSRKPSAPAWGGVALTESSSSLPSTPQSPKKEPHGLASIIQAEEARAQTQSKVQSSISPAQKIKSSTSSTNYNNNSFIGSPNSTCIKENYPVPMTSPKMSSFPSLTQSSPSFHSILKEEAVQRETLQKEQSKPLAFIQLEDKAIEELLEFYGASESTEERITVVRVKAVSAKPLWNK